MNGKKDKAMKSIGKKISRLWDKMRSKDFRDEFVAAQIEDGIASQIQSMRADKGWTQGNLAELIGTKQTGVSRLETNGNASLSTLKKVASAFDVGLSVRFVPFSEIAGSSVNFNPRQSVKSFDDDNIFEEIGLTTKGESKFEFVIGTSGASSQSENYRTIESDEIILEQSK